MDVLDRKDVHIRLSSNLQGRCTDIGEFERNLIRERVLAGQQRAKANGVKLGRPSKMNDGMRSAVKLLRENGMGIKQIARELQIGVGTVYSVISV